ncbi:MAG TPA: PilZ domain-containing protein [Myxococcales bacterium]|nr:PilZ domain-containing protein [Myxococcales bacterium]
MAEPAQTRKRTTTPVRIHRSGTEPLAATLLDISPSGAFVELEAPLEVGTPLEVELQIPADGALRLAGTVVRQGRMAKPMPHPKIEHLVVRVPGVGLRFEGLAANQTLQLGQFLSTLEEG